MQSERIGGESNKVGEMKPAEKEDTRFSIRLQKGNTLVFPGISGKRPGLRSAYSMADAKAGCSGVFFGFRSTEG